MRKLEAPHRAPQRLRARRWDAVILGSALPGLIAGTRLALGKKRVLLVEEENAARVPLALREPFLIPVPPDGVLDRCLRALGMPLIDRRRLLPQATAYQVILPGARADSGSASLTAQELVAWGLAKPDVARSWVEAVESGAKREREQILASPFVRFGGLRDLARGVVRPRPHAREDPLAGLRAESPALRRWTDSQVLALRGCADRTPPRPPASSQQGTPNKHWRNARGTRRLLSRCGPASLDPEGVGSQSPGSRSAPWVNRRQQRLYPAGV